jgi:hypothetical protein
MTNNFWIKRHHHKQDQRLRAILALSRVWYTKLLDMVGIDLGRMDVEQFGAQSSSAEQNVAQVCGATRAGLNSEPAKESIVS